MGFSKDIVLIAKYFHRCRTQYMEPLGLKGVHARVLHGVCDSPGISQDRLAQTLSIDKSNVARHVATLEEQGFLSRKSCGEDKRVLRLHPTQKTLELLPGLQAQTQSWEDALLGELTPEERTQLLELLHRVRPRIEREE